MLSTFLNRLAIGKHHGSDWDVKARQSNQNHHLLPLQFWILLSCQCE